METRKRRILCWALTVLMLLSFLTGCAAPAETVDETAPSPATTASIAPEGTPSSSGTRQVTDMAGNTVTIPEQLNRVCITSWMGAFAGFMILGKMDLVDGMCNLGSFPWLFHAYPQLKDVVDYGSFDTANVENILKADFDLILSPNASADVNAKMQELNMPVYVDGLITADPSDVFALQQAEINLVADLTGTQARAQEYYAWCDSVSKMIEERVSAIPDNERKSALCVRSNIEEVFGNCVGAGLSISMAGGINAAPDPEAQRFYTIDAEAVVAADPDYIFVDQTHFTGDNLIGYYRELQKDERYTDLKAVKSGDVYIIPAALSMWMGGIEYPLGLILMAKTMYPDLFKDIDPNAYISEFFEKFLDYKIGAEDLKLIAPNFEGAKTFGLY